MSEAISQYLKHVIQEKANELTRIQKKGVGPMVDDGRIYRSLRSYLESIDSMEVTDPYEKSVWVFASINAIAQNISRVPFYLYTEKTKDIKTIIDSGPLYDLFTNPNPFTITNTLFFSTVLFMELYGEAFWIFEGRDNITEIPKEIWVVNPGRFSPVIEKDSTFRGYWKYETEFKTVIFAPHEILHLKYYNPYDDIRGLSPIEASRSGVEQDYFANKYNKQFFKDGISLSGIIKAPDFLTDEQYNRLKNQFSERHAGYGNAHKVGIIEGGADFVATKAMSQRDMEFSVLKNVIRGEILAAFKTNEVVLGNYSNIQCYHPDTEVMTDQGFISVKDVKESTKLATFDKGKASFKEVTKTYIYDYDGDMYTQKKGGRFNSSYIDFMVTSEHKMFGKERKIKSNGGKYRTEDFIFKKVSEIDSSIEFCSPQNAEWDGEIVESFTLERRKYERSGYKNGSKDGYKDTTFDIKTWLKFLGWFISEGCFKSDKTFELSITQVKEEGRKKLEEDIKDFPYKFRNYRKEYVVSGKDLYNYLIENVGRYCHEKHIPREILNLHPELLKYLFETLMDGDGTKLKKGFIYSTTSKQLALDVFELSVKLGYSPVLYGGENGILITKNRYPNARPFWRINIKSKKSSNRMVVIKPEKVHYEGKVYCFEIPPFHNVLIRYNGKVVWCGNSYEGIRQAHESFWKETLLPKMVYLEEFLWSKFFSKIAGGKVWGGFDKSEIEALREDFGKKVETAKVLTDMGFPINMVNKRLDLGFQEVPWGNTWWVKVGMVPVESILENPEAPLPSNNPSQEPGNPPDEPSSDEPVVDPNEGKDIDLSNRDDSMWSRYIARQVPIENMFKNKIKRFLFEQRKRILTEIYKTTDFEFDFGVEVENMLKLLAGLYTVARDTGIEMVKEEIITDEDLKLEDIDKFVQDRIVFTSNTVINTIKNSVYKTLEEFKDSPISGKADAIRHIYNKADNRLLTIARTESSAILNGIRYLIMKETGIKYHKWISKSESGRHDKYNNKIVKIGESFSEDFILRYPLDNKAPVSEVIGCRCCTVPLATIKSGEKGSC